MYSAASRICLLQPTRLWLTKTVIETAVNQQLTGP
jgi:hypothetical protein